MPKPARNPVSLNGIPHGLPDDESDSGVRRISIVRSGSGPIQVHHHVGPNSAYTATNGTAEIAGPRHPVLSWEHSPRLPGCDQAVSERRPLPRREDTMARPARVRIRSRKPCTRARRRLFGWKVRLPLATAVSPHYIWRQTTPTGSLRSDQSRQVAFSKLRASRSLTGAVPGMGSRSQPYRPWAGDCSRVLRPVRRVKPRRRDLGKRKKSLTIGWQSETNLLASARSLSTKRTTQHHKDASTFTESGDNPGHTVCPTETAIRSPSR